MLMFYKLTPAEALKEVASTENGLSDAEAASRLKQSGFNELQRVNKESALRKFARQLKDLMIILLLVCSFISYILGDIRTTVILVIIVIINVLIGFYQEYKAENIMNSLERLVVNKAKVVRAGIEIETPTRALVVGDVILVEEGDSVPADARILVESDLATNDFALTGESNPSRKFSHAITSDVELPLRHNLIFMGTTVAVGQARAVVVATGEKTELGRIASLSQSTAPEMSPLQKEMAHIAKMITKGTLILGTILTVIVLRSGQGIEAAFIFALGVASAMIPQGLPAEVNTALAQAANALAKAKALVKKLSAVETLGATSIICTDKTGTLTKNQMTVQEIVLPGREIKVEGLGYEAEGQLTEKGKALAQKNSKSWSF